MERRFSIFEERGIKILEGYGSPSALPRITLDKLYKYINNYIFSDMNYIGDIKIDGEKIGSGYEIKVDNEFMHIEWIKDLSLIIKVSDIEDESYKHYYYSEKGNGACFHSNDDKIVLYNGQKVLDKIEIEINLLSYRENINKQYFMTQCYHELTHAYEEYSYMKDSGNSYYDNISHKNYMMIQKNSNSKDKVIRYANYIMYRLFSKNEMNALISSIYGELKGLNSQSFREDIDKLQAYKEYDVIKEELLPYILEHGTIEEWGIIYQIYSNNTDAKMYNYEKFKLFFKKRTEHYLRMLWNKMCKYSTLWYEENGINEIKGVIKMQSPILEEDEQYKRIKEIIEHIRY